jgi:hypothetical protein
MRREMRRTVVMLLMASALVAAGCESPEATRTRGGGPGGDVGNRSRDVKMHAGSDQFWRTPERIAGAHPPLESARHAQQDSRE